MRITVIVPCYNEQASLPLLTERLGVAMRMLEGREVELLFIDDGSTDGTLAGLREAATTLGGGRVIAHAKNRGLGCALRTGLASASGDAVVVIDSDCTYDPTEIPELLERLRYADVVLGSPYHPDGRVHGVPPYRLVLSKTLSRMYRLALRRRDIHTFTSMFRAYTRAAARDATSRSDDYLALTESLVSLLDKGYDVVEYPTVLHSRTTGVSKMRVVRTIRRHTRLVACLALGNSTRPETVGKDVRSWQTER